MKMKVSILMLLFCFLSISSSAQEKSKKELKEEKAQQKQKELESLIESKNFIFEAQKLTAQGGKFIILDYSTYFLKFNIDTTKCDLPFYGRGYNIPYGGDGGIKFEGTPEKISIQKREKNYLMKATVRGKEDNYDLRFLVFFDGGTRLFVTSNNRASICYDGIISAPN